MIKTDELVDLVERSEIGEPFNYDAPFMFLHHNEKGKLTGVIAYDLVTDPMQKDYPRFIHVILAPELRRTKEALKFVVSSFTDMRDKGYKQVVAVIPHWKKYMIVFAMKFGFKKFNDDDQFGYWVKVL